MAGAVASGGVVTAAQCDCFCLPHMQSGAMSGNRCYACPVPSLQICPFCGQNLTNSNWENSTCQVLTMVNGIGKLSLLSIKELKVIQCCLNGSNTCLKTVEGWHGEVSQAATCDSGTAYGHQLVSRLFFLLFLLPSSLLMAWGKQQSMAYALGLLRLCRRP